MNTSRRTFIRSLAVLPAALLFWRSRAKGQPALPVTALSGKVEIAGAANWIPVRAVTCRQEMYIGSQQGIGISLLRWSQRWNTEPRLVEDHFTPLIDHPGVHRCHEGRGNGSQSYYDKITLNDPLHGPISVYNLTIQYLPWSLEGRAKLAPHFQAYHAIARWRE